MTELLLDPAIRFWVFLPIVVITFLIGIVRHYVSILITSKKKVELQQMQDSSMLIRGKLLRENGRFLPKQNFVMRKQFFNDEETGYFKIAQQRPAQMANPMTDPSMMTEMLKGNLLNVLPMIVIGGWINWTFSGFVTTKVPFPLTLRFKPMLQRGVELASLDASWVSSASWYFLNVFGLRSIYSLVLGENNAADQSRMMAEQMSGAAMAMPQDPKAAFKANGYTFARKSRSGGRRKKEKKRKRKGKGTGRRKREAEWEALQLSSHHWALKNIEAELISDLS